LAVHDDGVFELDGNATNDAAPGADWANVYNDVVVSPGGTTSGAAAQSFITRDTEARATDVTYWKGGGSKDVRDISDAGVTPTFWQHSPTDSAPDTDDIQDAFAAAYSVSNNLNLYFGMDRFDTNGSSQVGFWFFKSRHAVNPDGTFSGVHDVGDLLVLSDFTTGGKVATVKSFKWVGSGGDTGSTLQSAASGVDCQDAPANDITCARVNSTPVASPWTYIPKGATADSDIPTGGLFEGGIDVNAALGVSGDVCFSQFLAETRSSGSAETAQLKDFATGRFDLCDVRVRIAPDDVNAVRDPHTFTVTVEKKSGGGDFVPAADGHADVTLTAATGASPVVDQAASTCDDAGDNLDANGQCTITFTSPTAGTVTGHAKATVTLGGETFVRESDGQSPNSGDAVKRFVDANITIAPDDTNEVGQPHTFTVTVKKNAGDGNGFVPASVGDVDFSLADQHGASSVVNTAASSCDDPGDNLDANGQCTIVFTSNSAGTVIGNASVQLALDGVTLDRDTDAATATEAGPGGSGHATKVFVDALIRIAPDDTNEVGQPHTFTVSVDKNEGAGGGFVAAAGGHVVVTLTNQNGANHVIDAGASTCDDAGDNLDDNGQCTLTFTSNSAGTVVGNAAVTLDVGGLTLVRDSDPVSSTPPGPGGSGPATKVFVDGNITIAPDQTNEVGQPHTFTVTVKKNAGDGNGFVPASVGDVDFTLVDHDGANSVVNTAASTCDDPGNNLDANGRCTIVFTSNTAGTVTGNASVQLVVGGVTLNRDSDPATANAGSGPGGSGPATKRFVNARITIAPDQVNEVGQAHTFTVTVEKNTGDGNGFVPATEGDVDFSLADHDGANSIVDQAASTCDDAGPDNLDANGQCTIVFTSNTAGTVTGNASVTLVVGGVTLTRDTDPATADVGSGPGGSGSATKVFVDARIRIAPDQTNEVGQAHTFTVTVEKNAGDGNGFVPASIGDVDFSLVDHDGANSVVDTAASTCDDVGSDNLDANGQCTIVFTSNSAGRVVGNASVTLVVGGVTLTRDTEPATADVGSGPGGSGPATKVFVDARISIAPDDTNEVGQPHTFTVTVDKDAGDGNGFVDATVGHVVVTLTNQNGASHVVDAAASTCDDAGDNLDNSGQCTLVFTSNSAGTVAGTAAVTLEVGGLMLLRDTDPVSSTPAGPGGSGPATKVFVDASITIAPDDTNGIEEPHTFTVTVKQNAGLGDGFVAATPGHVVVTLVSQGGAAAVVNDAASTCDDPGPSNLDANGQCTLAFTSNTAGTVIGNASVELVVGGLTLVRDTDPVSATLAGPNGSGPATKVFVDGTLLWRKVDQDGDPLAGARFEVCRTHRLDSAPDPDEFIDEDADVCFSVDDNQGRDADPADGRFKVTGLVLGKYTVQETLAPPGYAKDDTIKNATLDLSDLPASATFDLGDFVNEQLFRLIVITCNESVDQLVDSEVTLNGSTTDSITSVPAHLAGKGVTQSDLCHIGGAAYGSLDAGTYTPGVELPDVAPLHP
jgi:peptidyl-tRNA hydrolase